jgi:RimJ/RimL family protein N-acetyltransferase
MKTFDIHSSALHLRAAEAPWDSAIFGYPVAQISSIQVLDASTARADFEPFWHWCDLHGVRIVSCRLDHQQLRESMLLEQQQFRFIEMVLHPHLPHLQAYTCDSDSLIIAPAEAEDLSILSDISAQAFHHERYHVDPRLDPIFGNQRYARWVENSLHHPRQRLIKLLDDQHIIAFFIIEAGERGDVYWHLTAVAPAFQGRGLGRRTWRAMIARHQNEGHETITTTISARNTTVLNLYASLGFRFLPPEMTFHWVRE